MSRKLSLVDARESPKIEFAATWGPLLETKFHVPRSRSDLVARPRLLNAVHQGAANKLTVVVAPAGFGKTTLLCGWLAIESRADRLAAWVSLDPADNEPAVFWGYVIEALRRLYPGVGARAATLLQSPKAAPVEAMLTTLINEIDALDRDCILVLDDYHLIEAEAIHAGLTYLLHHLPRRMHIAIASRADPPLALPKLRARGELSEIRVEDLRFTSDESAVFLNDVMLLGLARGDAVKLEKRTEGWIAGLKLAALSMRGRPDVGGFVDAFSGDNRYVADYLVEEVLQAESEEVRRFLMATAILDRLSAPLCEAVTGTGEAQALLESLERRNLFLVALDDRREWYRYHHLFAEVLQVLAMRKDREAARLWHRQASAWYEDHASPGEAVHHALSSGDADRAAGLLECSWPEVDRSYSSRKWLESVKSLPEAVVRARPVLTLGYAWGLLNSGELEAAGPRLDDVEAWVRPGVDVTGRVITDHRRFQSLAGDLAAARVYLSQSLGDVPGTLEHAKRALDLIPESDLQRRPTGIALVALAQWGRGDLAAAHATFSEALAGMRASGQMLAAIRGVFVLGDILAARGRLSEARETYQHGLRLATEEVHSAPPETDELNLGLSELYLEWNDLPASLAHLDAITRSAGNTAHMGNRLRWMTAMAGIRDARGDREGALELLTDAERHERRDPLPRLRPIPAMKARIRLAQGRTEDAAQWLKGSKLSAGDALTFLREYEHVTLARILLATSPAEAGAFLERLCAAAEGGGRLGSVVEIKVLQSLAQHALGDRRGALDVLSQALVLAAPEAFLRVFLYEGPRLRDLLRQATARGLAGEYTRRVLAAFDAPPAPAPVAVMAPKTESGETLTARETEILRLIAAGMRNQDIAGHLAISAATVKRHIANAYGKLGAGHRTEALNRANELKLL